MGYEQVLSMFGSGGGGGGYGAGPTSVSSGGGKSTGTFGSVNFGAGASVGGTTSGAEDAGGSKTLLYVGIGVIALVALVILVKR